MYAHAHKNSLILVHSSLLNIIIQGASGPFMTGPGIRPHFFEVRKCPATEIGSGIRQAIDQSLTSLEVRVLHAWTVE